MESTPYLNEKLSRQGGAVPSSSNQVIPISMKVTSLSLFFSLLSECCDNLYY